MIVALAAALALQLSSPMLVASSCEYPNKDVKILVAVPPHFTPGELKGVRTKQAALVNVELNGKAEIEKASIVQSSGLPVVDRAAVAAARASTYAPATRNCVGINGNYLFKVEVAPSHPQ